jgi:hypothetical protein
MAVDAVRVDRATALAAVEADLATKERRSSSAPFAVDDVEVMEGGGGAIERATATTRWFVGAKAETLADDAARARMAAERCFMVKGDLALGVCLGEDDKQKGSD